MPKEGLAKDNTGAFGREKRIKFVKKNMAKKTGPPSSYTHEKGLLICQATSCSSKGLVHVSKEVGIAYGTILEWRRNHPEFNAMYLQAKRDQAEYLADEIIGIADDCEDPNKGRLQVEARKWVAAKLKPDSFGDSSRVQVEVTEKKLPDYFDAIKPQP